MHLLLARQWYRSLAADVTGLRFATVVLTNCSMDNRPQRDQANVYWTFELPTALCILGVKQDFGSDVVTQAYSSRACGGFFSLQKRPLKEKPHRHCG